MPSPSAPIIKATGPLRSTWWMCWVASPAVPVIHTPASCKLLRHRARLVTCTKGIVSAAPQATLLTVLLSEADLSFGAMTACTPAASAVRKQAPKLWGSVTPSRINKKAGTCKFSSRSLRKPSSLAGLGVQAATTPW